ncbi:MAG: sel1 repeat family protein [Pseudooceanicola sp.]|nr:sel1 repeat family protein [Pseudooceanicola sp.]
MKALALAAALGWAGPSWADPAQALFDAGDYAGAAVQWRADAAEGSAKAQLQLGLLADRGLGQARDPVLAFRWYRAAAEQGLAEAQFNAGVMLDAGIGVARDATAAFVWYSRAALRGHVRAQFNAALMLRAGDLHNPSMAAYWLRRAESLPAARAALETLPGAAGDTPRSPEILFQSDDKGIREVIWRGSPGPGRYALEVLAAPTGETYGEPVAFALTGGSGVMQALPDAATPMVWRVVALSGASDRYAATPWHGAAPPLARLQIVADTDDPRVTGFARRLAQDLRHAGFWVRLVPSDAAQAPAETSIGYAWAQDRAVAVQVAAALPAMNRDSLRVLPVGSTLPGEIVLRLGSGGARVARVD